MTSVQYAMSIALLCEAASAAELIEIKRALRWLNWSTTMTPFFYHGGLCALSQKIGTSVWDAYLAAIDGSVSANKYHVTNDRYKTEPMRVILSEANKF